MRDRDEVTNRGLALAALVGLLAGCVACLFWGVARG